MWQRSAKAQVPDFKQALTLFGHLSDKMFKAGPASEASARAALARARCDGVAICATFEPFSLVVDLASEPVGPRWFRGAATLATLCGAALVMSPGFSPFSAAAAHSLAPRQAFQMNAMLVSPDAQAAATPLAAAFDPVAMARPIIASSAAEIRVQGAVTEGLYWSLREAGVPSETAAEYLQALASRIDVGADVAPFDRFDLVVSKGEERRLLYAALHRVDGPDVELMKWAVEGNSDWFDTDASGADQSSALMAPVAGRITSGFGFRHHPILRFARMHAGIDFGAAWGSPIVAAADGEVAGAGWNGGYGRQVRLVHDGGIVTTYSHMSGIAAAPGETVRQGQVIGYVGSTGLSTGPHLHFEVLVNGQRVDPMQVEMQRRQQIAGAQKKAFDARLRQLKAIGKAA